MRTDKQRIRGKDRGMDRNTDTGRNENIGSVFGGFHRHKSRCTTGRGHREPPAEVSNNGGKIGRNGGAAMDGRKPKADI